MKTNLLNFDLPGLTAHFAQMGEKPFRARQVMRWMHLGGIADFTDMTDLAKSLRHRLSKNQLMVHANGCLMLVLVMVWKRFLYRKIPGVRYVFLRK